MNPNKLIWKLFPSYLFIAFVTVLAITAFSTQIFRTQLLDLNYKELDSKQSQVISKLKKSRTFNELVNNVDILAGQNNARITLFNQEAISVWDSDIHNMGWDAGDDAVEVHAALQGNKRVVHRYSRSFQEYVAYYAEPIDQPYFQGVVRVSQSVHQIYTVIRTLYLRIFLAGAGLLCLVVLISYAIARQIETKLEDFRQSVESFSKGNLRQKVQVHGISEFEELSEAMNSMAQKLDTRYKMVLEERNEKNAILGSMGEGVITVDHNNRITGINEAAQKFVKARIKGPVLDEKYDTVLRDRSLIQFIEKSLKSTEPIESIWTFNNINFIQAHGTTLKSSRGKVMGALIVLSDVTKLKRLESMRKDFVANVSHELKTPVTVISGFVETLLDGGVKDSKQSRNFLEKIASHTERIQQIIDDLLMLSGLERSDDEEAVILTRQPIKPIISSALEMCQLKNKDQNLKFEFNCSEKIESKVNGDLFEVAVLNLLDNAAKYSEPGQTIKIDVDQKVTRLHIAVRDEGCGIPEEDQSRVFERFYRVHKGRSRKIGGTGLGLAILKHIITTHNGEVKLKSELGIGSEFKIILPNKNKG